MVSGKRFEPNARVELRWYANRVLHHRGSGEVNPRNGELLRTVRANADGNFVRARVNVPRNAAVGQYVIVAHARFITEHQQPSNTSANGGAQKAFRVNAAVPATPSTGGGNNGSPNQPVGTRDDPLASTDPARTGPAVGSVASDNPLGAAGSVASDRPATGAAPAGVQPSERSASGDLWGGFGPGTRSWLTPPETDAAAAPSPAAGSHLAVGVGLLGLGMVALVAGLGVAEARRRRALARPGQTD